MLRFPVRYLSVYFLSYAALRLLMIATTIAATSASPKSNAICPMLNLPPNTANTAKDNNQNITAPITALIKNFSSLTAIKVPNTTDTAQLSN